jgi:DNA-directed RNA polymerase
MTTPYGVTINSSAKYVVSEYLADPAIQHQFTPTEFGAASRYLMQFMWPAIGDVVVKSRAAMTWLKGSSKLILADAISNNDPDPVVSWVTPSGFLATQGYFELKIHRIRTLLHGEVKIRVASESDKADMARHASGMAPNFVHSMDASHLHLVTHRAVNEGIKDLAMIHDDFGTHAAHSERFSRIIREEFVSMYENHDPLGELVARYPFLRSPPKPGTLDLSEVLRSEFFFS